MRHAVSDGLKSEIQLTAAGQDPVAKLEEHWVATFAAIARLEEEIGYPLRQALEGACQALEVQRFSARITAVKSELAEGDQALVE